MLCWDDIFTGVKYTFTEQWQNKVRKHLAGELKERLNQITDAQYAADCVAQFWWEYYGWLFPLRFGIQSEEPIDGKELFKGAPNVIELESYPDKPLRGKLLDGDKLPPLLPAHKKNELISDHSLAAAALTNVLLRQSKLHERDSNLFHQLRLGVLLHELADEVNTEPDKVVENEFPHAWQVAQFLTEKSQQLPEGIDEELLRKAHCGKKMPDEYEVAIVVGAVQRVKQFVFESPGLNEIRGASTLLDQLTDELREMVNKEIGPEVVLRAAGSTIEFLAPHETDANGKYWTQRIREHFYRSSGSAFIAAGAKTVKASQLLTHFQKSIWQTYQSVQQDRNQSNLPIFETLPFEERCFFCKSRPAEKWFWHPEERAEPACRICITKRKKGQDERKYKGEKVIGDVGITAKQVGVESKDSTADKLDELIPSGLRRKLLAVIYGDGNNFGDVVQRIESLAMNLQWTHRVEKTTRAAVGIALARAINEAAKESGNSLAKLPFQVLALGGDDVSLITWGRIGLRFCERFLALTDMEFQQGSGEKLSGKPICFSLGALFVDEKAPVRRTVAYAEGELMKWAKRAAKERQKDIRLAFAKEVDGSRKQDKDSSNQKTEGTVAFLLAVTAEQIPADLKAYRKEMFLRGPNSPYLNLTLRPFTAKELEFLLDKVQSLKEKKHRGRLYRLAQAFVQESPKAAMLHYIYQKGRENGGGMFEVLEQPKAKWKDIFNAFPLPAATMEQRLAFGEEEIEGAVWSSPLWDLLEITKILE